MSPEFVTLVDEILGEEAEGAGELRHSGPRRAGVALARAFPVLPRLSGQLCTPRLLPGAAGDHSCKHDDKHG
jgi:hypothetical protein